MVLSKTIKNRFIKYSFSPSEVSPFSPPSMPDCDVILFSVSSESFPHVSKDGVSVISVRSSSGKPNSHMSFFDLVSLLDSDTELFCSSILTSGKNVMVFPCGNKTLIVFTRFLRACGMGLALKVNISPSNAASLAHSELTSPIEGVLFSPSLDNSPKAYDSVMELYRATSLFAELNGSASSSDKRSILDIIRTVVKISQLETDVEISLYSETESVFEPDTVFSLLLCFFFHARRMDGKGMTVKILGEEKIRIAVEFSTSTPPSSDDNIPELLFCEKAAENMGTLFSLDINENTYSALFIPLREAPSAEGFKSGIFVNGKRFINPFLL